MFLVLNDLSSACPVLLETGPISIYWLIICGTLVPYLWIMESNGVLTSGTVIPLMIGARVPHISYWLFT